MRRELGRKPLNSAIDFEPIVALGGLDESCIFSATSNRLGRLSTVPVIRAENTSNPPWPNAWRVAARSRLKIEPRNGAGIDACGADEPMIVLYLPP